MASLFAFYANICRLLNTDLYCMDTRPKLSIVQYANIAKRVYCFESIDSVIA